MCDRQAAACARLLKANITKLNPSLVVCVSTCGVKRKTEGDCNRGNVPACSDWQRNALALSATARMHIDVHSCNKDEIYTITRPHEYSGKSQNRLQRALVRALGISVRRGTNDNYMIMNSRCAGSKLLIEFSSNEATNKAQIPSIAAVVCEQLALAATTPLVDVSA